MERNTLKRRQRLRYNPINGSRNIVPLFDSEAALQIAHDAGLTQLIHKNALREMSTLTKPKPTNALKQQVAETNFSTESKRNFGGEGATTFQLNAIATLPIVALGLCTKKYTRPDARAVNAAHYISKIYANAARKRYDHQSKAKGNVISGPNAGGISKKDNFTHAITVDCANAFAKPKINFNCGHKLHVYSDVVSGIKAATYTAMKTIASSFESKLNGQTGVQFANNSRNYNTLHEQNDVATECNASKTVSGIANETYEEQN